LEEATLEEAGARARRALAALTGLDAKSMEAAEGSMPPLPEESAVGDERGALRQLALWRDLVQLSAAAEYQARQRAVQGATLGKGSIGTLVAARVNEQIALAALAQASARLRAARLEVLAAAGALEAWAEGRAAESWESAPEAKEGDAELVSLILAPAMEELAEGRPQQFSAIATFAGGHARDVTAEALWSCPDQTRAALSTTGLLTGMTPGRVTVRVTYRSMSRSRSLTIIQAPPDELLSQTHENRKR
ncbi:MAG: Ig-like domain-containing protein, partial [Terracidiphilus sp.]